MTDVLRRLVGEWTVVMDHVAMGAEVTGRAHYEPVLDGAFLLVRTTYDSPDVPDALAVLSPSGCHYFDVRGVTRVFDVAVQDAGWSMTWLDEGFSVRTVSVFRDDDLVETTGEASADRGATWQHDFMTTARRVAAGD